MVVSPVHGELAVRGHVVDEPVHAEKEKQENMLHRHPAQDPGGGAHIRLIVWPQLDGQQRAVGNDSYQT